MFSYKFFIDADRDNDLRLRIINNRKKAELSMGLRWTPEQFADAQSDNPSRENISKKAFLAMCVSKLELLKMQLVEENNTNMSAAEIKTKLASSLLGKEESTNNDAPLTFLKHFDEYINRHSNKRTREIYQATVSRIKSFDKDADKLQFEDITVQWLTRFDTFLAKTSPARNARNIHFRNIRAVIRDAFKADLTTAHPFDRFSIKPEPTRKRSFSIDTLRYILNAEVEPHLQKYLDFFKLSFMLIGINVVDLCSIESINDGRIDYIRSKTHKPLSIKVEPEAMEIINKYIGEKKLLNYLETYSDYRHFYKNMCTGLRVIKERLGLKELTTYWARHSWATIARKLGISIDDIALCLSHSSGHKITRIYIDEDRDVIDRANRRVLDYVLYDKK